MSGKAVPVYDKDDALARLGGDLALCREALASFLGETPAALEALELARRAGQTDRVRILAHALKGAAATVGAAAFAQAAREVERAARDGRPDLLPDLCRTLGHALLALRTRRDGHPAEFP